MRAAAALIRLGTYEVETLQKRLADVDARRVEAVMRIAALDAEAEAEDAHARDYAEAGLYLIGFREGWKLRRARAQVALAAVEAEAVGARDALTAAFEQLKKVEHVATLARFAERREEARREGAALDELALRRTGTR